MNKTLVNALGIACDIAYDTYEDLLDKLRALGEHGVCAQEIVPGIVLPYAIESVFDWRLLGAKKVENGVWWRGHFWRRRSIVANPAKNMPALVRYSRGKANDEGNQNISNQEYIILVDFKGDGPVDRRFAIPSGARPALVAVGQRVPAPSAQAQTDDDLLAGI